MQENEELTTRKNNILQKNNKIGFNNCLYLFIYFIVLKEVSLFI